MVLLLYVIHSDTLYLCIVNITVLNVTHVLNVKYGIVNVSHVMLLNVCFEFMFGIP